MRHILSFLGFGRTDRLARMARKATERVRRAYGPTFGFYPAEYRFAPRPAMLEHRIWAPMLGWLESRANEVSDAGNVREILYIGHGADFSARWSHPAPYRAGWGIPVQVRPDSADSVTGN